jgi:hypothetical protein
MKTEMGRDWFQWIHFHKLTCRQNVLRTLKKRLCFSRDGVLFWAEKGTCRQDSISKWIDCTSCDPNLIFIRQYL